MASLKDEEQATNNRQNNNNSSSSNNNNNHNTSNNNNNISSSTSNVSLNNNNNNVDAAGKRESLEARKQALEQRLSEKSWLLQQIQKQETAIMHGNYEHLTVNEFFAQLAQQYKHEQQLQALAKESGALLRRKQSTTSRSESQLAGSHNNINNNGSSNNNRHSETHSNRSSEYDNYQPSGSVVGDMLVIGVAQQQSQQHPHVKSALKKRPTPTPTAQMQYAAQAAQLRQPKQQQQHLLQQHLHMEAYAQQHAAYQQHQQQQHQQLSQTDVISMYSANSSNVATLRQQHVAPQQQPIIVQCDKYYLSPTHQSYNEGGFIKSSQNIKKYVSPLASPSAISYEQSSLQHQQHQRQLDAISLAPSYMSVEVESVQQQQQQLHHQQQQQQYRWRSQSHIAALTPPHPHQNQSVAMSGEPKSHSSDMLAAPMPRFNSKPKPLDEISLCSNTISEKKPKPKQWLESSLDGPAVVRQIESTAHSPVSSSSGSAAGGAAKPRTKLSSQSMSVSGRHYSMSAQRSAHNTHFAHAGFAAGGAGSSKGLQHADERFAKLSQSTSYLNAMEQTMGISASYPLEPLDIPPFRHLPPKPNHSQQPTPPPRPPPVANPIVGPKNLAGGSALQNALVSPPLSVVTATASGSLSPDIRIESPKNMTVVQQATFQPYKEETKPFEMSDFYKYSTKFKQKEGGRPE